MKLLALHWILLVATLLAAAPPQAPDARAHMENGVARTKAGDLEGAERELRQALLLASKDPEILGTLGSILAMREKFEESSLYLEKALAMAPDDLGTRRNLARNQWKLRRFREAGENLQRVLRASPGDPQATLLLGLVAESEHDHARAVKLLTSVPALVRAQPVAITALASAYYHTGEKDKARATLDWMASEPPNPQATYLAARVAMESRDYEVAERLFSSLGTGYPDRAGLGFNIALAQYHQDHFAQSERTLTELLAAGGSSGPIFNLLGWCFEKQGKRSDAIEALTKAIELEPSTEAHYLDLAGILSNSVKRLAAALAIARRATQLFPSSYSVWTSKGSIESKLQQYQDAIQSYEVAVRLKPDAAEPRRARALAQWSGGESADAIQSFEQLIKRFPNDALNYEAYGAALLSGASTLETNASATRLLQRALALDPSLAEAHYYLGNAALAEGNSAEALRQLEAAAKLEPQTSKTHFALSRALKRAGRDQQSKQEYEVYTKLKGEEEQAELR